MQKRLRKIISFLICFLLIFEQSGFAQVAPVLDLSSAFSGLRNSLVQDKFRPVHLRYLNYDNVANNFKLLLDKGDAKNINKTNLEASTKTLLKYFFIGLSIPNEKFWVNLRPDGEENVIDPVLARTDAGKILLEADLQLKKDTALATSPQTPEGKAYWSKLYQKAGELFGSDNVTIPTLTRPWIVPGEIIIRESDTNAYVYKATLKVMLEQDYLKDSATYNFKDPRQKALNEYSSELIRATIIPKLTREINTSKRYAPLRQLFYSLILAQWFKSRFYGKGGLYSWVIDKENLNDLTSEESWSKNTYFKQYQSSFKNGEYNIQEPANTPSGQVVRSYFSGGIVPVLPNGLPPKPTADNPVTNLGPAIAILTVGKSVPAVRSNLSLEVVSSSLTASTPFSVTITADNFTVPSTVSQTTQTKSGIFSQEAVTSSLTSLEKPKTTVSSPANQAKMRIEVMIRRLCETYLTWRGFLQEPTQLRNDFDTVVDNMSAKLGLGKELAEKAKSNCKIVAGISPASIKNRLDSILLQKAVDVLFGKDLENNLHPVIIKYKYLKDGKTLIIIGKDIALGNDAKIVSIPHEDKIGIGRPVTIGEYRLKMIASEAGHAIFHQILKDADGIADSAVDETFDNLAQRIFVPQLWANYNYELEAKVVEGIDVIRSSGTFKIAQAPLVNLLSYYLSREAAIELFRNFLSVQEINTSLDEDAFFFEHAVCRYLANYFVQKSGSIDEALRIVGRIVKGKDRSWIKDFTVFRDMFNREVRSASSSVGLEKTDTAKVQLREARSSAWRRGILVAVIATVVGILTAMGLGLDSKNANIERAEDYAIVGEQEKAAVSDIDNKGVSTTPKYKEENGVSNIKDIANLAAKGNQEASNNIAESVPAIIDLIGLVAKGKQDAIVTLINIAKSNPFVGDALKDFDPSKLIVFASQGDYKAINALSTLADNSNIVAQNALKKVIPPDRVYKEAKEGNTEAVQALVQMASQGNIAAEKSLENGDSSVIQALGKLGCSGNVKALRSIIRILNQDGMQNHIYYLLADQLWSINKSIEPPAEARSIALNAFKTDFKKRVNKLTFKSVVDREQVLGVVNRSIDATGTSEYLMSRERLAKQYNRRPQGILFHLCIPEVVAPLLEANQQSGGKVDIEFLTAAAFAEGYILPARRLVLSGQERSFSISGPMGLDRFGSEVVELKRSQFLRRDYPGFEPSSINFTNEAGDTFIGGEFRDSASALEALSSLLLQDRARFLVAVKRRGFNAGVLGEDQIRVGTYLSYVTGDAGRFMSKGSDFVGNIGDGRLGNGVYDAQWPAATANWLEELGIFTDYVKWAATQKPSAEVSTSSLDAQGRPDSVSSPVNNSLESFVEDAKAAAINKDFALARELLAKAKAVAASEGEQSRLEKLDQALTVGEDLVNKGGFISSVFFYEGLPHEIMRVLREDAHSGDLTARFLVEKKGYTLDEFRDLAGEILAHLASREAGFKREEAMLEGPDYLTAQGFFDEVSKSGDVDSKVADLAETYLELVRSVSSTEAASRDAKREKLNEPFRRAVESRKNAIREALVRGKIQDILGLLLVRTKMEISAYGETLPFDMPVVLNSLDELFGEYSRAKDDQRAMQVIDLIIVAAQIDYVEAFYILDDAARDLGVSFEDLINGRLREQEYRRSGNEEWVFPEFTGRVNALSKVYEVSKGKQEGSSPAASEKSDVTSSPVSGFNSTSVVGSIESQAVDKKGSVSTKSFGLVAVLGMFLSSLPAFGTPLHEISSQIGISNAAAILTLPFIASVAWQIVNLFRGWMIIHGQKTVKEGAKFFNVDQNQKIYKKAQFNNFSKITLRKIGLLIVSIAAINLADYQGWVNLNLFLQGIELYLQAAMAHFQEGLNEIPEPSVRAVVKYFDYSVITIVSTIVSIASYVIAEVFLFPSPYWSIGAPFGSKAISLSERLRNINESVFENATPRSYLEGYRLIDTWLEKGDGEFFVTDSFIEGELEKSLKKVVASSDPLLIYQLRNGKWIFTRDVGINFIIDPEKGVVNYLSNNKSRDALGVGHFTRAESERGVIQRVYSYNPSVKNKQKERERLTSFLGFGTDICQISKDGIDVLSGLSKDEGLVKSENDTKWEHLGWEHAEKMILPVPLEEFLDPKYDVNTREWAARSIGVANPNFDLYDVARKTYRFQGSEILANLFVWAITMLVRDEVRYHPKSFEDWESFIGWLRQVHSRSGTPLPDIQNSRLQNDWLALADGIAYRIDKEERALANARLMERRSARKRSASDYRTFNGRSGGNDVERARDYIEDNPKDSLEDINRMSLADLFENVLSGEEEFKLSQAREEIAWNLVNSKLASRYQYFDRRDEELLGILKDKILVIFRRVVGLKSSEVLRLLDAQREGLGLPIEEEEETKWHGMEGERKAIRVKGSQAQFIAVVHIGVRDRAISVDISGVKDGYPSVHMVGKLDAKGGISVQAIHATGRQALSLVNAGFEFFRRRLSAEGSIRVFLSEENKKELKDLLGSEAAVLQDRGEKVIEAEESIPAPVLEEEFGIASVIRTEPADRYNAQALRRVVELGRLSALAFQNRRFEAEELYEQCVSEGVLGAAEGDVRALLDIYLDYGFSGPLQEEQVRILSAIIRRLNRNLENGGYLFGGIMGLGKPLVMKIISKINYQAGDRANTLNFVRQMGSRFLDAMQGGNSYEEGVTFVNIDSIENSVDTFLASIASSLAGRAIDAGDIEITRLWENLGTDGLLRVAISVATLHEIEHSLNAKNISLRKDVVKNEEVSHLAEMSIPALARFSAYILAYADSSGPNRIAIGNIMKYYVQAIHGQNVRVSDDDARVFFRSDLATMSDEQIATLARERYRELKGEEFPEGFYRDILVNPIFIKNVLDEQGRLQKSRSASSPVSLREKWGIVQSAMKSIGVKLLPWIIISVVAFPSGVFLGEDGVANIIYDKTVVSSSAQKASLPLAAPMRKASLSLAPPVQKESLPLDSPSEETYVSVLSRDMDIKTLQSFDPVKITAGARQGDDLAIEELGGLASIGNSAALRSLVDLLHLDGRRNHIYYLVADKLWSMTTSTYATEQSKMIAREAFKKDFKKRVATLEFKSEVNREEVLGVVNRAIDALGSSEAIEARDRLAKKYNRSPQGILFHLCIPEVVAPLLDAHKRSGAKFDIEYFTGAAFAEGYIVVARKIISAGQEGSFNVAMPMGMDRFGSEEGELKRAKFLRDDYSDFKPTTDYYINESRDKFIDGNFTDATSALEAFSALLLQDRARFFSAVKKRGFDVGALGEDQVRVGAYLSYVTGNPSRYMDKGPDLVGNIGSGTHGDGYYNAQWPAATAEWLEQLRIFDKSTAAKKTLTAETVSSTAGQEKPGIASSPVVLYGSVVALIEDLHTRTLGELTFIPQEEDLVQILYSRFHQVLGSKPRAYYEELAKYIARFPDFKKRMGKINKLVVLSQALQRQEADADTIGLMLSIFIRFQDSDQKIEEVLNDSGMLVALLDLTRTLEQNGVNARDRIKVISAMVKAPAPEESMRTLATLFRQSQLLALEWLLTAKNLDGAVSEWAATRLKNIALGEHGSAAEVVRIFSAVLGKQGLSRGAYERSILMLGILGRGLRGRHPDSIVSILEAKFIEENSGVLRPAIARVLVSLNRKAVDILGLYKSILETRPVGYAEFNQVLGILGLYDVLPQDSVRLTRNLLDNIIMLMGAEIYPVYILNAKLKESANPVALVRQWGKYAPENNHDFDINDEIKIALEYGRFFSRQIKTRVDSAQWGTYSFDWFDQQLKLATAGAEPEGISPREKAQLFYCAFEVRKFFNFVMAVKAQAEKFGRKVLVIPNFTYETFLLTAIKEDLKKLGVIASEPLTRGRSRLFDADTLKSFNEQQPVIVVMSGTDEKQANMRGRGAYKMEDSDLTQRDITTDYTVLGRNTGSDVSLNEVMAGIQSADFTQRHVLFAARLNLSKEEIPGWIRDRFMEKDSLDEYCQMKLAPRPNAAGVEAIYVYGDELRKEYTRGEDDLASAKPNAQGPSTALSAGNAGVSSPIDQKKPGVASSPIQRPTPLPTAMGGTGFQIKVFNILYSRRNASSELILKDEEREIILWGLLDRNRLEYFKILQILSILSQEEIGRLKDMVLKWAIEKDNMPFTLQASLDEVQKTKSIITNFNALESQDLEFGLYTGFLPNGLRLLKDELYSFLRSKFDETQAERLAQTLARMNSGSLEMMFIAGVITREERDILLGRNIGKLDALTPEEKDNLSNRLAELCRSYNLLSSNRKTAMMRRLLPLAVIFLFAQQYSIDTTLMFTTVKGHPDFPFWLIKAKAKVEEIKDRVNGSANAWLIVTGQGLDNVDFWLAKAKAKVEDIRVKVGSPSNAWRIVINQGVEGADKWIADAMSIATGMVESGRSPAITSAWFELIMNNGITQKDSAGEVDDLGAADSLQIATEEFDAASSSVAPKKSGAVASPTQEETKLYPGSTEDIKKAVDTYETTILQMFTELKGGAELDELSRERMEKIATQAYFQLMQVLSDYFGEITYIYPLMGPDIIPSIFRNTFPINYDPDDFGRGERLISRMLGPTLAQKIRLLDKKGRDVDVDLESYVTELKSISGRRTFILKGFRESNSRLAESGKSLEIIQKILKDVLNQGDFVVILRTADQSYGLQNESLGFTKLLQKNFKFSGQEDFWTEENMKALLFPDAFEIWVKSSSPIGQKPPVAVSSPVVQQGGDTKGGIDLRALPIVTQAMPGALGRVPSGARELFKASSGTRINNDKEWQEIQNMISAGIIPSSQRIKDYIAACCAKGDFDQDIDKILGCIADIFRMEEERVAETDQALTGLLVLLETKDKTDELAIGLSGIKVLAREPKRIEK